MRKIALALLCFAWLHLLVVNAQIQRISGVVTGSESGNPLPGVSVLVKGTTMGTVTNREGFYQLIVPENTAILVFSYVGLRTVEMPVTGSIVNAVLESESFSVDEVVVVAYGTSEKSRFSGSLSTIRSERLERFQSADFTKTLQGLASGVVTTSGSGQPGEEAEIRIRGFNTFGNASPLVVLDGFPYDGNLSAIPLSEIESITILKDASATALYGSRAANGVIIITTKTGLPGVSGLSLNVRFGISHRAIPEYDRVSVPEYYELQWEGIRNALIESGFGRTEASSAAGEQLISALGGYNAYNVPDNEVVDANGVIHQEAQLRWNDNWQDALFVTGKRSEIVLSARGTTDKSAFFISGAVLNDNGIIKASGLNRYSVRVNLHTRLNSRIKTGIHFSGSLSEQNFPVSSGSSYLNPFMFTGLIAPVYPVYLYDAKGELQTDGSGNKLFDYGAGFGRSRVYGSGLNPLGTIALDKRQYKKDVFTLRSFISFELTKGLNFETSVSADHFTFTGLTHQNMKYGDGQSFSGRTFRETNRTFSWTANQMFRFSKTFDEHAVQALAAHENYNYKLNVLSATRSGFPFPGLVELDAAAIAEGSGSYEDNYRMESFFAKIDYSYKDRYFAGFNLRTDGNSRFAREVRWGSYWAAGVSWLLSEEPFMQNLGWLELQLKASYGQQGNDKIGSFYGFQGLYETGINNINYPGLLASRLSTPGLTWETLKSTNLGFVVKFLDRFALNFDYYFRQNNDLLFEQPLPPSTGFSSIDANIAKLLNAGFDLEISGLVLKINQLRWNMDLILGHFKNEIQELPQEFIINSNKRWETGRSIYEFWIEEFAGVNPETGKSQWYYDMAETDENGNVIFDEQGNELLTGERGVTESYGQADRYYVGSSIPVIFGGFNNSVSFGGFDLSVLLNFGIGGKVMDQGYQWLMHSGQYGYNFHRDVINRWSPENKETTIPAVDGDQFTNRRSTRFLTDASYLSFRNVSFGYQLPSRLVSKINIEGVRVHFFADNLALVSARKGLDPQQSFNGNNGMQYMPLRTLSLGFDVQF